MILAEIISLKGKVSGMETDLTQMKDQMKEIQNNKKDD